MPEETRKKCCWALYHPDFWRIAENSKICRVWLSCLSSGQWIFSASSCFLNRLKRECPSEKYVKWCSDHKLFLFWSHGIHHSPMACQILRHLRSGRSLHGVLIASMKRCAKHSVLEIWISGLKLHFPCVANSLRTQWVGIGVSSYSEIAVKKKSVMLKVGSKRKPDMHDTAHYGKGDLLKLCVWVFDDAQTTEGMKGMANSVDNWDSFTCCFHFLTFLQLGEKKINACEWRAEPNWTSFGTFLSCSARLILSNLESSSDSGSTMKVFSMGVNCGV